MKSEKCRKCLFGYRRRFKKAKEEAKAQGRRELIEEIEKISKGSFTTGLETCTSFLIDYNDWKKLKERESP